MCLIPMADNSTFDTLCADFEDIAAADLKGTASKLLGKQYLEQVTDKRSQKLVRGTTMGASLRPIISLHVQISDAITTMSGTPMPVNVHFLYLAVSPQTYMSDEALRSIGVEDIVVVGEVMDETKSMRIPLLINGYLVHVLRSPADSHFAHINILGEDFVYATRARVYLGGDPPTFAIAFPLTSQYRV
ncbi:hypothetical protein BX616_002557 [Lobosporangium transversale]|uniref:Uncharacterized protein n=1 Tax=Lobosporangium transversale TaxID=64571 RepID=A0A1Y2GES3_9FUNG|nr:hypothetical protein BCR41DRAFT_359014 [Lobosporangium transversale]KAF9900580.1 hypothetical protein BX616_002557 [Lobosporangium transversale]ORZ08783.1 hypothetical protein BCR41DRAFT_359014 [Lobosporangium transversale]|eukprot:XP_021878566.1 hypothetical protein BCR41DRAFT_359014 [Lobosporangium transversale]